MKIPLSRPLEEHIRTTGAREIAYCYLQILAGCFIGAAAYPAFLIPNNIAPGGLTGVATILNYLFQLPVGTVSLVMNIPLFLIGYRSMGQVFAFRSLIATLLFSALIDLIPIGPVSTDPLLGTLFGGVVLGIGLGLILRGFATTGGTDMIARMVHRRLPFITVGMFLFVLDCVVVLAAAVFIGTEQALYAFINIYVCSKVIDAVMMGFAGNKACFIMSPQWQRITERLMDEVGRGVTHLDARGAYSGKQQPVVLCVASRQEIMAVKRIVREEDESAFMFITEAHEALGEGFSRLDSED
ncbi:MAG: YitT family protein [Clostridia bacterium]|nr:YitT family protein [Clostridia bacterium]